jgi:hypothetical protein
MPLVFRCISPPSGTVLEAISGNVAIGFVRQDTLPGKRTRWIWRLNVTRPTAAVVMHGFADDLDGAQAALEANWGRWLELAGLHER